MDESQKKLLEALRRAVQAEVEGWGFYGMAALTTTDPQGKKVFEALAAEEMSHASYLKAQYRAILETGAVDAKATLGKPKEMAGGSPIFSDSLKKRIGDAHFEMSALGIAVQLEHDSMVFYREQAKAAADPAVRAFFGDLAAWEQGHHEALSRQQEALKEDYWQQNGFAPF